MKKEKTPYELGSDCALNGPNEENCHFSIFSTIENTKMWETGKHDAEQRLHRRTL